ncbi:hypothetical protein ACVD1N_21930 [Vibrio parahaemolyticus]|nr:hypothetical protein [Vibrio parahaemolyticus]EKH9203391.1 hypothetical protein [Vibrio parahaemolyticus]
MLKNAIILVLIFMCIWFYMGESLKTYDGCVSALRSEFTAIEDFKERTAIAKAHCDDLVAEGKVLPAK